jgi:hypothetical protein
MVTSTEAIRYYSTDMRANEPHKARMVQKGTIPGLLFKLRSHFTNKTGRETTGKSSLSCPRIAHIKTHVIYLTCLFEDAVKSSNYMASNDRMINE